MDGAIEIYGRMDLAWRAQQIAVAGKRHGFDVWKPIQNITTQSSWTYLLYGDKEPISGAGGILGAR